MKKTGKWLAKLLAVALLMNLLPVFAMAADTKDSTPVNSVFLTRVDWLAGTAQVKNRSDTTVTARFILAAYDANGRMIGKSTADERTLEAGESAELTVKLPAGTAAERLKVFVLDTATGAPLCQALERVRSAELIVDKAGTVTGGTYQNVTITSAVGDGEVTLKDVTINDELMIQGGGSNSIKLVSCHVNGRVAMEKPVGTQTPRLELTDTPLGKVVANQPAIIEAVDAASTIQLVKVSANVEIRGPKMIVHEITAAAPVRIADGIVNTITVPDTAQTQVAVTVESHAFVGEIAVHSPSGAAITNDGSVNALSAADAEAAKKITLGGSSHTPAPTAHIHSWDGGVWAVYPACDVCGELTRTCTVDGCGAVKSETVLPLGHALGSGYDSNETGHWHTCQRCGQHAEKAAHVYAGTNCAEADVCAVCGYEKPAGAHSWDEGVVTKEPTFTEPGEKTYTCTSCGATMTTQKHPLAGDDQLMLIESAEKQGLLTYLTLNDLGSVTRLEMAKLLVAFRNINLDDVTPAEYGDCAGLTEQEKRIVGAAVNRNLMAPYQDGTFRPEAEMTRAAAAEVFYRLLDQPVTDCTAQFADVEQGAWYWAAVTNLYNFGLITGTSANTFSPNAPADKEALLSWLVCGKDWNDPRPAVPTVENAWFAKTPAAIALCIQQPADMSEIDYFRLEMKGSDGTWVDYGTFTGDWVDIPGERLDGTYTRIKITSVPKDPSRYAKGVWKMDCALTVVNQKLAAPDDVTFSKIMAGNTISGYSVEVQGLSPNTDQVIVQLTAKENGYGLRSYMAGNIFANETAAGKDVRITLFNSYPTELLPDGYYRVLEVLDASVTDATTASLTVNSRGDWEKVPPLKAITDPRPAVPAVKGFAFLKSPAALELEVQQPDDMSGINCFRWEFQDAAGNWVDLGTFTGRPPILGDDMNGVYSRIRITSIPKDEAQYQPGVLEAPCQLTIENEQAGAPDAVTFTGFTEADGIPRFRAQVHGLQSDTDQAVIQLSARANGRGRRSEIAGNRFFDDNGTTKSFSVAVRAEHFLNLIPGGYYRVLEVKEAAVTDDSTAYLKVRTRGDWEQVELQGGSPYEPVSNLRFEERYCPTLVWERPAGDSDDTQYRVFLSTDSGASWLYAHSSRGEDYLPPYICTEGSYNAVKVVTRVNGYDVASCVDTDLRLDISRGDPLTGIQLSLEPLSNGGMRCTISGLAPYTSHTLFMGSEPGSYRSSMSVFADENGTWTQKGKYFADGMYYYIQEYSNSSISADGKTASFTVRGMSDWEQANLQGGITYEPVSNLRFEKFHGCLRLTWDTPASQPDGAVYRTYLSQDGGASWLKIYSTQWNFMVPGYKIPAGTYDRVKVATLVNGHEVTAAEEAISLTVTEGATLPAASLTLSPITGVGYACTVTGLTPEASFGLFFRSADGTYDDHVGILRADSAGNCTGTLGINERVTAYYRIDEYSNSAISADGKTASYTASSRGGWIPVELQGGEEVKAATIKDVYYVDVVWSDSKIVAGSASTTYYAQLVNLYSGFVSEVVLEKRDHEVAGIDADLSVADLAALAGKLVTISDKKVGDSKKDNDKFNLKSWSDKDWDVTAVSAFDKDFTKSLTRITGDGKTYRLDGDTKYLFLENTKKDLDVSGYIGGVAYSRDKVNSAIILTEGGKTLAKYVVILTDDADQIFEYSEDEVFIKSVSRERGDGYISQTVYLPDGSKEIWQIDDGEFYTKGKFYNYGTNSNGYYELEEADAMAITKNFVWDDEEGVILNATIAKDALYGTLLTVTAGGYTVSDIETKGAKFVDLHDTDKDGAYDRTVGSLSRLCDLVDDEKVKTVEMFLNVSRDGAVAIFVTTINV